jgi:hypothetical protein
MDGEETTIAPYRDGPLLVRGPFRLVVRFSAPSGAEQRS